MLSSHAMGSIDGGLLPSSVPSPVQGLDQLHVESQHQSIEPLSIHVPVTSPSDAHISETLPSRTPAALTRPSGELRRYDSFRSVDQASHKIQSPLRNSVSFTDLTKLDAVALPAHCAPQEPQESQKSQAGSPDMSFTGDKMPGVAVEGPQRRRFSGWFGRAPNAEADSPTCSANKPLKIATSQSNTPKVSPSSANRRFSFFGPSISAPKTPISAPVLEDDELASLDIQSALFPGGQPNDGAAFSPAAFKNLQMVATGLLTRFQVAYQQRTTELRDIRAEQEVKEEEQSEMETRVQHLKMQLEEMGRKVAERESSIQTLLDELTEEKQQRMEEHMARAKAPRPSDAMTISEDLGVEEDQRRHGRRSSAETTKSDSSLDTDEESIEEASIFSISRSPTMPTSAAEIALAEQLASLPKQMVLVERQRKQSNAQSGPFQKFFKGQGQGGDQSVTGCHKCKETGLAWETVNLLKSENKGLKDRVVELETAVDTALDAVNGLMLL